MPTGKVKEVAAMLKAIHAQEDARAAREKAAQIVEKLRVMKLGRAAEIVAAGVEETLSDYSYPSEHWRSLRTNNPRGAVDAGDPTTKTGRRRLSGW